MTWRCSVCRGQDSERRYAVTTEATENGVDAHAFRPSADRFGETVADVVRCVACGHGSLGSTPSADAIDAAYRDATDPESADEVEGQLATAGRALAWVEQHHSLGALLDLGCWTGSFVQAAQDRGWSATGLEPSQWAVEQAHARGLDVRVGDLFDPGLPAGSYQCVALCDVLEHLLEPSDGLASAHGLLAPGGLLYLTVPDAGSLLARAMGRRWWSVLPMHVQYFTRASLRRAVTDAGFEVLGMKTHPKVFTLGYYLGRIGGYSPALAKAALAVSNRLHLTQKMIGPDFRDRVQLLARRTP